MNALKKTINFLKNIIFEEITPFIIYSLFNKIDSKFFYDKKLTKKPIKQKIKNNKPSQEHFAILICPHGRIISKTGGFFKIYEKAYESLKKRGFKDSNIILLCNIIPKTRKSGISARPNIENFKKTIKYLKQKIPKNGSITFYYTGHGIRKNNQSRFYLLDKKINQSQFYKIIKSIKQKKIFIFDQCFSGGFFNELKNIKNTAVMASTKQNKQAANVPEVEMLFWEQIGKGKQVLTSYKFASKKIPKEYKQAAKIIEIITKKSVKSYYLTNNSKIDIPKPTS